MLTPDSPNPMVDDMIIQFTKKLIEIEKNVREKISRISNKFNKK